MTAVRDLAPRPKLRTRPRVMVASAVIAAGLGFLLFRGLGDATLYFHTADEAVAQRAELGERRFRIEGMVEPGTVEPTADGVSFRISSAGVAVAVRHHGEQPELFQEGIPVVLEGHFAGRVYESDRILVRHTSEYKAEHPERVKEAP